MSDSKARAAGREMTKKMKDERAQQIGERLGESEYFQNAWNALANHEKTRQLALQGLAEALRETGCYLENEKRHCWCGGGGPHGGIVLPHQDYCLKARAALDAATPFLELK